MALTTPEKSRPGTNGSFVCLYSPRRTFQSAALTLAAKISTATSPEPATGSGNSPYWNMSGPPYCSMNAAFIWHPSFRFPGSLASEAYIVCGIGESGAWPSRARPRNALRPSVRPSGEGSRDSLHGMVDVRNTVITAEADAQPRAAHVRDDPRPLQARVDRCRLRHVIAEEMAALRRSHRRQQECLAQRGNVCSVHALEEAVLKRQHVRMDRLDREADLSHPVEHGGEPVKPAGVEGCAHEPRTVSAV